MGSGRRKLSRGSANATQTTSRSKRMWEGEVRKAEGRKAEEEDMITKKKKKTKKKKRKK